MSDILLVPIKLDALVLAQPTQVVATVTLSNDSRWKQTTAHDFLFEVKEPKLYPGAMWGKTHDPSAAMNAPPIRAPGTIGFRPETPSEPGHTKSIQRDELDYDVSPRQLPPADGEQLTYTCIDPGELSSQLKDSSASRDGVLKALGIDPRTAVRLSDDLATTFVEAPLVVRSTAA